MIGAHVTEVQDHVYETCRFIDIQEGHFFLSDGSLYQKSHLCVLSYSKLSIASVTFGDMDIVYPVEILKFDIEFKRVLKP